MKSRWLSLLLTLGACAPSFTEPSEVKKPRIMLAKVVIDGDGEGRTRPRPGETFSIELFLMSPERPQASYTGDLATCLGTVLPNGTLACAAEQEFAQLTPEPYQGNDRFVLSGFEVPAFLDELPPPLNELKRVSLFGSMCVDGEIERVEGKSAAEDPVSTLYRCVDNDASPFPTQLPFTMSVWLDRDGPGDTNHNPSFACDPSEPSGPCHDGVEHDGEQVPGSVIMRLPKESAGDAPRSFVWEAWDPSVELPWDNCAEAPDSLPRVHVGDKAYDVYLRFDKSDRENYEREILRNEELVIEPRREQLVIQHALTTQGGRLDSFASFVAMDRADEDAEIELQYTPPPKATKKKPMKAPVPAEGRLVRFYFGVRDQRGGVDFTTRELCLLPADEG